MAEYRLVNKRIRKVRNIEDYFLVNKETNCWEWKGRKKEGYAQFYTNGERLSAHRIMYEKYREKIPAKMTIDHLCKNKKCVNPSHLEAVSLIENIRRGSNTKINMNIAIKIKELYSSGNFKQKELASLYGIGQYEISRIVNERRWNK